MIKSLKLEKLYFGYKTSMYSHNKRNMSMRVPNKTKPGVRRKTHPLSTGYTCRCKYILSKPLECSKTSNTVINFFKRVFVGSFISYSDI